MTIQDRRVTHAVRLPEPTRKHAATLEGYDDQPLEIRYETPEIRNEFSLHLEELELEMSAICGSVVSFTRTRRLQ